MSSVDSLASMVTFHTCNEDGCSLTLVENVEWNPTPQKEPLFGYKGSLCSVFSANSVKCTGWKTTVLPVCVYVWIPVRVCACHQHLPVCLSKALFGVLDMEVVFGLVDSGFGPIFSCQLHNFIILSSQKITYWQHRHFGGFNYSLFQTTIKQWLGIEFCNCYWS